MATCLCKRFFISGKVQGVWYRAATREQAVRLGLSGYAQNLADGRVEVLACGEKDTLALFANWLWHGPELAQVETVEEQSLPSQTLSGFSIR